MNSRAKHLSLWGFVLVGHLLFFGLLVLSLIHFKERVIYVDSAFQVFKWIEGQGFYFEAHRYSAIVPQLVVKLLKLLDGGLINLLKAASITPILLAWGVFSICAHILKNHVIAIACAIAAVLCTRVSFYSSVLEIHYLLSYPFLFLALLYHTKRLTRIKDGFLFCAAILAFAATLVVHPLGFLIVLYMLVFKVLSERHLNKVFVALIVVAVLWGLFGRFLFPATGYEAGLYSKLTLGFQSIHQFLEFDSFNLLIDHTWNITPHYLPVWIMLATTLYMIARRGDWVLFIFTFLSCAGFLLITILTYFEGESSVMLEKSFLPLATLIALPFVFEMVRLPLTWRWIVSAGCVVILFFQYRAISFASRPMVDRYNAVQELVNDIHESEQQKVIISGSELEKRGIHIHWALPYETILSSALYDADSTVVVFPDGYELRAESRESELVYWKRGMNSGVSLNSRYFSLTEGPYSTFNN